MKFIRILAFILVVFATASDAGLAKEIKLAPQEIIEDYMDIADNYAFSGDYKKALEYVNMVVYFEPMNPMAKYKQAMLLTTLNKNDEAREIFAQAIRLNPEFANTELAQLLTPPKPQNVIKEEFLGEQFKTAQGEAAFEPVSDIAQNSELSIKADYAETFGEEVPPADAPEKYSSEYYNQLGLQLLNEGDNVKAYEYFKKAVELDKKNFDAHNNLGLFYWQQGEKKLAEKSFRTAAKLNPSSTKPLLNLGLLYKEMEKEGKYFDYISKAIKLNPKDYLSNWVMGNYYYDQAQFHHAAMYYKKSVEYSPDFYDAYISLGNALASANRFDEAYAVFEKALTVNSTDPNLYFLLSKTASVVGKNPDAKQYILAGLELAQTDAFYLELAKICQNMGDFDEALEILMKHFANTNEPEILNYIGLSYYKMKQPEIALTYFKRLISIDQTKTIYLYNIALCYKSLGDRKAFFKYVDMATKILPKAPQDYIDLSYIYFDNGNKSYALNILNEGILRYPDVKKLYLAKLSLYQTCGDNKNYVEFKSIVNAKFSEHQAMGRPF